MNPRTATAAAAAALLLLSACGGNAPDGPDGGDTAGGAFTWTDARGEKVSLDHKPKTVVAQSSVAAALWDAGFKVQGVYGELGETDGELNYQAGSLDLDDVTVLGKTYGEFDEVAYANLAPELLVDFNMTADQLWYVPAKQATTIEEMAPTIGLQGSDLADTDEAIETMTDLAAELGADTEKATAEAKADYDKAEKDLTAAAAKADGVRVALISVSADGVVIWNPKTMPEAQTMAKAGVTFVTPDEDKLTDGWNQALSYEQLGTYDFDVVMLDARTPDAEDVLAKVPTWSRLPAVKAGQVYEWRTASPYSYAAYAPIFADAAEWLRTAKKVG